MKVELSETARERIRYLLEFGAYQSVSEAIESTLWGIDGPALEAADGLWESLVRSATPDGAPPIRRTPDEVAFLARSLLADKLALHREEEEGNIPRFLYLGPEASQYIAVFVQAGTFASAEEAVNAALESAIQLTPLYDPASP